LISFRAHGDSTGDRNDFGRGARHDVIAAVKWLEARRPESRIVVWGMSLGAAAAIFAAGELGERVSGYVLECPYRDLRTAVRHRTTAYLPPVLDTVAYLGLRIVSPLVLPDVDAISPIEAVRGIPRGVPVLLVAGSADDRAPAEEVEEMRGRMNGPVELLVIAGGAHARLREAQPQVYEARVEVPPAVEGR
jgi:pimeloyl-ACP methyl ester carboxylesterase